MTTKTGTAKAKKKTFHQENLERTAARNAAPPNAARVEWPAEMLYAIDRLTPSPTNPRTRFPEASIAELAGSIRDQGVIEPLILRAARPEWPDQTMFEIVCGERRWRSAKVAGEAALPAHVRELTDDQVIDIQIHENLHREDVHPMDEASGYKKVQDRLGCDIKELAARVGKTEGYVLNRLKLNELIKEAQKDIDDGCLPLVYALEIAKYPADAQRSILEFATYHRENTTYNQQKGEWNYKVNKEILQPFGSMKKWIDGKILYRLASAPFDLTATNLRDDGLACVNCPSRTGASVGLFDKSATGKKDSCLDPGCFNSKYQRFVTVTREAVAQKAKVPVSDIPLVDTEDYNDDKKEKILGRESIKIIGKPPKDKSWLSSYYSSKRCTNIVKAIDVDKDNYGQVVEICPKSSGCKDHHPSAKPQKKKTSKDVERERERELDGKRQRREEIFNSKIAEEVRRRVIVEASKVFAPKFSIKAPIGGFTEELVKRCDDIRETGAIVDTLRGMAKLPKTGTKDARQLAQMLFFYIHCSKGEINSYGNYYKSQRGIKVIAADYDINYTLIDAEVRLEQSPLKYKKQHQLYLDAVRTGSGKAKQPRLYSENWKRND